MNKKYGTSSVDFDLALDQLIGRWPDGTQSTTIETSTGTTHVLAKCGHGVPIVLLPGGSATGASWCRVAQQLPDSPVFALDIIGDAGRSSSADGRLAGPGEMRAWLDDVLAELGAEELDLVGHSYGGWVALSYALARPGRIRRLSLVSPSMCFSGMSPQYILRALPVIIRPSGSAARRLELVKMSV